MSKRMIYIAALLLTSQVFSVDRQYQTEPSPMRNVNERETVSDATVRISNHPSLGKILTDSKGMTLYMFTPDKKDKSVCYDQCAKEWPPLLISNGFPRLDTEIPGQIGFIVRQDNTKQVTYNGMPLYYYVKDKKVGDVTGQNVERKWFVINPEATR